jgi:hypothetical protein
MPIQRKHYQFPVVAEQTRGWLTQNGFVVEDELIEADSYSALFCHAAMTLNLNTFKTWPEVQRLGSHLEDSYTGKLYVEVNFSMWDTDIELGFSTRQLGEVDLTESLPLHQFSLSDLKFHPSQSDQPLEKPVVEEQPVVEEKSTTEIFSFTV